MDDRSERVGRRFEPVIIIATLLVVPVLILEELESETLRRLDDLNARLDGIEAALRDLRRVGE